MSSGISRRSFLVGIGAGAAAVAAFSPACSRGDACAPSAFDFLAARLG